MSWNVLELFRRNRFNMFLIPQYSQTMWNLHNLDESDVELNLNLLRGMCAILMCSNAMVRRNDRFK